MKAIFSKTKWDELLDKKPMEQQWTIFTNEIQCVLNRHVPCKKLTDNGGGKKRKPAWMNDKVLSRIKKKKSAFELYKQTRNGKDYLEYCKARKCQ
jgi:hypothetical protein